MRSVSQKYPGYQFIPGWFSWSNTIVLGKQVGATPNGRHAFEPINHGANPHPGFRKDGALTAMSNSICAVQPGYGNTAPVQLELDPGMGRGEEAVQKIADYIMTLFEQGATLLNINIVNGQQILEADKDPKQVPQPGGTRHGLYGVLLLSDSGVQKTGGGSYSHTGLNK